jgi:Predicted membrane protein (DUF2254)
MVTPNSVPVLEGSQETGGAGGQVPTPGRTRLLRRRWRLWWRFQVRALPHRPPFRYLRPLRSPDGSAPLKPAQLGVGRFLGRWYLRFGRGREHLRIERARLPDRIEPVKASVALVRLQGPLLAMLGALIVIGVGSDLLLRGVGVDLAHWLGVEQWLRDTFAKPSAETLRDLLAAAAAGTATILGLVISISLIVWQATADRYRSTGIVEFLLRERIGSAVVRLLALGFAYSLWVLAMLELFGHPPYASAAIALVLSTAAVLSLVSYRNTGLLGYVPAGIAGSLRLEIIRELHRARRDGAGRSVEDYSRRVVAGDLQIFEDLLQRLGRDGDPVDAAACIDELARVGVTYLVVKHELEPESFFFERHSERLGAGAPEIEESILRQGLMDPTREVPDHLWLERRIVALVESILASRFADSGLVAEHLCRLWGEALQVSWRFENLDAFKLFLAQIESAGGSAVWRSSSPLAEMFMTLPWLMVEAVGAGLHTSAEMIVDQEPWLEGDRLRNLPWAAREEARDLGTKIRAERRIAGGSITPREAMIGEVVAHREPIVSEMNERMLARATAICREQLDAAAREGSTAGATVARMTLRMLLRAANHGLEVPFDHQLAVAVQLCVDQAEESEEAVLAADLGRAARMFAERRLWGPAKEAMALVAVTNAARSAKAADAVAGTRINLDTLYTAAILFGWAEFHRWDPGRREFGRYVEVFFDFEKLTGFLENRGLHMFSIPNQLHYMWVQPLTQAVNALPDRPVKDGGIGYSLVKDHPSPLFARTERIIGGPDFFLRGLVAAVETERRLLREELARVLADLRRHLEEDS